MKKKNTETKAIAPKIRLETSEWYETIFTTLNAGATWTLETFPHIYRATIGEMRGMFSPGELGMILDVLNGHGSLLSYGGYELAGQHLRLSIEDSFHLYPGSFEEKWGIDDKVGFEAKLANCSRWELLCLEIWASAFWHEGVYDKVEISDYCAGTLL